VRVPREPEWLDGVVDRHRRVRGPSQEASLVKRVAILAALLAAATAAAQPHEATDQQKADAKSHFDQGLAHFDRQEWAAALVEFLKSRELYPTRGNTKDAAICLRKVGRFDEALAMYEALVHDFSDLSADDKALAEREMAELQGSVGTIAITGAPDGADVMVDGVDRGKTPLPPLRLSVGTHAIRITKDGALPFEQRIDLAGRQAAEVHATLAALTQAGRLQVSEKSGKAAQVFVDGALAGTTPWEGALAPGPHTVWLVADGNTGTAPVSTDVKLDQVGHLDLTAVPLGAALRVDPKPAAAAITVDGVFVGRGHWDGRLPEGSHEIVATLDGYTRFASTVAITDAGRQVTVEAPLEPVSFGGHRGVALEVTASASSRVSGNSELASGCSPQCSSSLPLGGAVIARGSYELTNGIGVGLHAGYMMLTSSIEDRMTSIASGTLTANGAVKDTLLLHGFVAGVDGYYRTGGTWPIEAGLGIGVLIGTVRDRRTGEFVAGHDGTTMFPVDTQQEPGASYLDVAPSIRFGHQIGGGLELQAGIDVHVLANLGTVPHWDATKIVPTGPDGGGVFTGDAIYPKLLVTVTPGISVRYPF
jgi:hypothetical protein